MLTLVCNECRERLKQPQPEPDIKPEGKDVRRRRK